MLARSPPLVRRWPYSISQVQRCRDLMESSNRESLDSITALQRCTCDIEYGHRLTKGGLLANIAYRTGERLYWDDERERFTGHTRANQYVTRRYRKPWKLI